MQVIPGTHGVTWIDRPSDQAYRRALMNGCPVPVRGKMQEALAQTPHAGSRAHSLRYFGKEMPAIQQMVAPLIDELHWFLHHDLNLPQFKQWLHITGYANEYRMIKAMVAWAEHMKTVPESEKLKWPVH